MGNQDIKADETLDAFGLLCPIPIHLTDKRIREMKPGAILEVISDDDGIVKDMPAWCNSYAHKILSYKADSGLHKFYIRKQS